MHTTNTSTIQISWLRRLHWMYTTIKLWNKRNMKVSSSNAAIDIEWSHIQSLGNSIRLSIPKICDCSPVLFSPFWWQGKNSSMTISEPHFGYIIGWQTQFYDIIEERYWLCTASTQIWRNSWCDRKISSHFWLEWISRFHSALSLKIWNTQIIPVIQKLSWFNW